MFEQITVLSLDLDDTLWDCRVVIQRAEQKLYQWLKLHYPKITQRYSLHQLRAERKRMDAVYPERAHDLKFIRIQTFRHLLSQAGYSEQAAAALFQTFYRERNRVTLYPDVLPALQILSRHYRLVALTNGNADLRVIGIADYFNANLSAGEVGFAKPHIEMFKAVQASVNCRSEEILHVGDNPDTDVEGARNAGIRSVWMNRTQADWTGRGPTPRHQVACMQGLCELLLEPRASLQTARV